MRLSWATITRLRILRRSNQAGACVEKNVRSTWTQILTPGIEENIQPSLSDVVPLDTSSAPQTPPRYYSALKKAHKDRVIPELREEDLEEAFVRGMAFNLLNFTNFLNSIRRKWAGVFIHCRL
jgi:hypothetical protein